VLNAEPLRMGGGQGDRDDRGWSRREALGVEHFGPGGDRGLGRRLERYARGRCATMDAGARRVRMRVCARSRAVALSFGQVPGVVTGQ
jgi:hypothetical protein